MKSVLQPRDVAVPPAAIDHVILAVLVLEHELVDRLRAVVEVVDQRLAQIILERPFRLVGHRHPDAADFFGRSECRWRRRTGNTCPSFSTMAGAHIARRAHVTAFVSRMRLCLVQFTRSGDENASRKTCWL